PRTRGGCPPRAGRRSGSAVRANAKPDARAGPGVRAGHSRGAGNALRRESIEHATDLGLELVGGGAVDVELSTHGIADGAADRSRIGIRREQERLAARTEGLDTL